MVAATRPGASDVSIVSAKGEAFTVEFSVETIVNLRRQVPAAVRVEPTLIHESSGKVMARRLGPQLCEDDLGKIDMETLAFAGRVLSSARNQPTVITPLSFFTLSARRGRQALADTGGCTPEVLKASLMVELLDVDKGTPISRLTEVGGLIGGICRTVLVRVQPGRDMLAVVRGYRVQGVSVDGADLGPDDTQIADQLLEFGEQAVGAAPLLIAQGLPNDGFLHVAAVAGITHGGVRLAAAARQKSAA